MFRNLTKRIATIIFTRIFNHQKSIIFNYTTKINSQNSQSAKILLSSTALLTTLSQLLFNKENEDSIVLLIKKGLLAQSRSQYQKAEDFFHDAIKLYDKLNKKSELNPIYRVNIYLYLANLYYESAEYERSFRVFQECLRELIAKFNYKQNNESIIEISLKLSNIFAYGFNMVHDAKIGYEFCIESILTRIKEYESMQPDDDDDARAVLEKNLINAKILFIMILHTYGRYLLNLKENSQALNLLEQAKILAIQLHELKHVNNQQLATLLNDLGIAYYSKKNYNEAINVLNSALDYLNNEIKLNEMNKDEETYDRAKYDLNEYKLINLSNLCSSYYALKKFDYAKNYCQNTINLFNKNNFNMNFVDKNLNDEIDEIKKILNDINAEIKKSKISK